MDYILQCEQLTKKFSYKTVIDNIDLNIPRGRIIGLLGPNGCGKTTLIKMINGLLVPNSGKILVDQKEVGIETKKIVSYLPERTYLNDWMSVEQIIHFFNDFYEDFDNSKAFDMLSRLKIDPKAKLRTLSKGTREKVQLILVMSRDAQLYCLDEPIAGVDPAARDYILSTIINNYSENASILLSTHLISDVENILDEVLFLKEGKITLSSTVDDIRYNKGQSVDSLFREVFKC